MKRAKIAAGCGVAAAVLLAGCTHDSGDKGSSSGGAAADGGNIVLASYATTTKAHTARLSETSTTQFPGAKHPFTQTLKGVVDFTNNAGELTSDFAGMKSTNLFIGGKTYQKLPKDLASLYGASTPWITYSLDSIVPGAGQQSGSNPVTSPLQALSALQGATDKTEKLGTETIDGTRTTHYRATIDMTLAVKKAGIFKGALSSMAKDLKAKHVPCELWLDDQGRVRRQRTTTTMTVKDMQGKPAPLKSTETLELTDFGTKVDVTAPPKDQVTDVTAKMKELRNS